ncbi:hypothetical protein [Methylobacter sp.]|uniref:hypothetical protein n=1 Tax=Methylobacter sp. TaxID=2051955 RepID=UPI003DA5316B
MAEAAAAVHTVRTVALQYGVSLAFVCRMHVLWRETGAVQGEPSGDCKCSRLEPYEAAIKEQLAHSLSMTLKELQSWLEDEHSLSVRLVIATIAFTGFKNSFLLAHFIPIFSGWEKDKEQVSLNFVFAVFLIVVKIKRASCLF